MADSASKSDDLTDDKLLSAGLATDAQMGNGKAKQTEPVSNFIRIIKNKLS